ncbi:transposase [Muriventricola aceti]|uniref:transposase n=1 Tax=Muriventricola aceti TaxID=2981773 RepID=UPI00082227EC|nr:transposase [Muriventricola aceti]MCU6704254.1 transposase [Muriventricola aceti]SCJ72506.1 Transposase [uncultured Flavonifractor sp.]
MSEIEQCLNCTLLDCVNCLEGAGTTHRKYSREYKREIVERNRNGESIYSIANDTGIDASTIRYWIRQEKRHREG